MIRMDVRFEADAVGHRVGEFLQALRRVGRGAEDVADVHFAALEEAGAKDAVSGETEAIARRAEGRGHRGDEADSSLRIVAGEAIDVGGADAGFARAVD